MRSMPAKMHSNRQIWQLSLCSVDPCSPFRATSTSSKRSLLNCRISCRILSSKGQVRNLNLWPVIGEAFFWAALFLLEVIWESEEWRDSTSWTNFSGILKIFGTYFEKLPKIGFPILPNQWFEAFPREAQSHRALHWAGSSQQKKLDENGMHSQS